MFRKQFSYFIFLCLIFSKTFVFAHINFFDDPMLYTKEQLDHELKSKVLDMSFNFGPDSYLKFNITSTKIYYEIALGDLPATYDSLINDLKAKYCFVEDPHTHQLLFSYERTQEGTEIFNQFIPKGERHHSHSPGYIVTERREFENANPTLITEEQLKEILSDSKVLFYTGAGLSIAADIPDMAGLEGLLNLSFDEKFLNSLVPAFENPAEFADKIAIFHKACLESEPTEAHHALAAIAKKTSTRLLTENLDSLHEISGIYPYRIHPKELQEDIDPQAFKKYNYLVCVGLSHDDRGFIGWYKKNNPDGKIISIDLNTPSYLGDEDYVLHADLQQLLPSLMHDLKDAI